MIWVIREFKTDQVEVKEFKLAKHDLSPNLAKGQTNV
jgi:hypothetical protein